MSRIADNIETLLEINSNNLSGNFRDSGEVIASVLLDISVSLAQIADALSKEEK